MMTITRNASRTNSVATEICPVTGERGERRPDCVLGWRGRQEYEAEKATAIANGKPAPDIFAFATEAGMRTIVRLRRDLDRKGKEEDARFTQIRNYAEKKVAEQLREEHIMIFTDQRQEMVVNLTAKLAPTDQVSRKIRERAKKLKAKIQLLQTYLRFELPKMRADARRKQVEGWFASVICEPGRMPEMAVAI